MILSNSCVLNERYTIQSVLGEVGPFDVNYLAWDLKQEKEVVVREYYPVRLAKRAADGMLLEVHDAELFEYGLGAYSAEGLVLTKVEHAFIAGCQEQFKQNGTVYCVSNFISGAPLGAYLNQQNNKLSEDEAIPIMEKVLLALQACHERKLYHGGISPRAILIDTQGNPVLLGFQGARFKLARESETLKDLIKPGYSAPEQTTYTSEEGPWWDIYGSAATLFNMLTGTDLPAATDGWSSSKIKVALYRDAVLSAEMCDLLAVALSFSESDRPASIRDFREMVLKTQKKPVHQLHEGDGAAPQLEIGYSAEDPPHEAVWQNGVDVTAAKIKIETEAPPVAMPLVEENEMVEREMPNVVPSNPPQLIASSNGQDVQQNEQQNNRSSGREQELEVLLTKMVKWQQVFVAFILGIVVIALLGLIGGVFFGPTLFQQSSTTNAPAVEGASSQATELAAAASSGPLSIAEAAPLQEGTIDEEEPLSNDLTTPAETSNIQSVPASVESAPEEEEISQPVNREPTSREPARTAPAREPEVETDEETDPVADSNDDEPAPEPEQAEAVGPFFTDEELGVAAEEEASGENTQPNERESLFNYYRVQADSLMNQGFTTAALQWYKNALKYNTEDTYINEQISAITRSIALEARQVKEQDSLMARLEQVRDQNGIFVLPDTPVTLVDEAGLRSKIEYPIAAINGGISGRIILRYVVDADGQIQDINVVKGLGWGTEDVVIDLLRKAQFTPATFNGETVKAWGTFTTVFKLKNR